MGTAYTENAGQLIDLAVLAGKVWHVRFLHHPTVTHHSVRAENRWETSIKQHPQHDLSVILLG